MKTIFLLLVLLCAFKVNAQNKDTIAQLLPHCITQELSIPPNERIWLITACGDVYHADDIHSYWHYDTLPYIKISTEFSSSNQEIHQISFFNNDTAIATGNLSSDTNNYSFNDGFYKTIDGGKSWKLLSLGVDAWINNVTLLKNGKVWLADASGKIFYSSNYGDNWTQLNSPFRENSSLRYLYMNNDNVGIAGTSHNEIYITLNNWETSRPVLTPFNQNKYLSKQSREYQSIYKIQIWKDKIVVNQEGKIFYSNLKTIGWKSFPLPVIDFEINNETQDLFAITKDLEIIRFTEPDSYIKFGNENLVSTPKDLKIVNNTLYSLDEEGQITKVNDKEFYRTKDFYTLDHTIPAPENIAKGNKIFWGEEEGQILLSEDFGKTWYRYTQGSYFLSDINLINDSSAIFWDVIKDKNYLYSIPNKTPEIYYYPSPLDEFLKHPITKFTITSASSGCFHYYGDEIEYLLKEDSTFESKLSSKGYKEVKKFDMNFEERITHQAVNNLLKEVNSSYKNIPTLSDFKLANENKKYFLKLVEKRANESKKNSGDNRFDKKFYSQIANRLDTLNPNILESVFEEPNLLVSTTSNGFRLIFTNAANDSIIFYNSYSDSPQPWYLGWEVY